MKLKRIDDFDLLESLKPGSIELKENADVIKSINRINTNQSRENKKIYKPSGMYKIGQRIYHPVFNDTGKVIKKKKSIGDYGKIVVRFDHIGEKLLVERKSLRKVKMGNTILVHYTSRLEDGSIVDSTRNKNQIKLTLGKNEIFPAVEKRIIGMVVGESKNFTIPPSKAYGRYRKNLVFVIDRKEINVKDPKVGEYHKIRLRTGDTVKARFTKVDESKVTLDANHILAGKDITYEIEVLKIVD